MLIDAPKCFLLYNKWKSREVSRKINEYDANQITGISFIITGRELDIYSDDSDTS